ncbi:nucleotidyltransferase domain-containing protein [Candidatus Sumerlaeota bacterium]|nr:nucleotidyltransferase domain-containing protein [Candidatus Sumerlaeota bacterium]
MRQIATLTGGGQGAVQRELKRLADADILTREKRGNLVYYHANHSCPVFEELHSLIIKTSGIADVLRQALNPIAQNIKWAFVYGSLAEGSSRSSSDIDLMIVGEPDEIELHRAISDAEKKLSRPLHYTLFHPREFQERRREEGGFVQRILKKTKINITGNS